MCPASGLGQAFIPLLSGEYDRTGTGAGHWHGPPTAAACALRGLLCADCLKICHLRSRAQRVAGIEGQLAAALRLSHSKPSSPAQSQCCALPLAKQLCAAGVAALDNAVRRGAPITSVT
jgi:hypothetical protein